MSRKKLIVYLMKMCHRSFLIGLLIIQSCIVRIAFNMLKKEKIYPTHILSCWCQRLCVKPYNIFAQNSCHLSDFSGLHNLSKCIISWVTASSSGHQWQPSMLDEDCTKKTVVCMNLNKCIFIAAEQLVMESWINYCQHCQYYY